MNAAALARTDTAPDQSAIEQALVNGDLARLTPTQRVSYYRSTCESLGLNPLTKPFSYLQLNGKLVLYALRECSEQLRRIHRVSLTITARELLGDVYVVTARARIDGREDESTGAVSVAGLKGEPLANAYMKSETKAKRRVTLSICGLGMLDESELDSVRDARAVHVDNSTGEVIEPTAQPHARLPSTPPPALAKAQPVGPDSAMVARFGHRVAEIESAATVDALRKVGLNIAADGRATHLSLDMMAELRAIAKARKDQISIRDRARVEAEADAELERMGDLPPSYGAKGSPYVSVRETPSGTDRIDWSNAPREPGEEG